MQHLKEAWHFEASGHASKMALDKMVASHQPITLVGFEKPSPMSSKDSQYAIQHVTTMNHLGVFFFGDCCGVLNFETFLFYIVINIFLLNLLRNMKGFPIPISL